MINRSILKNIDQSYSINIEFSFIRNNRKEGTSLSEERIKPWPENPYYWEYDGKPTLLLGARMRTTCSIILT